MTLTPTVILALTHAARIDLAKWRRKALHALKDGRHPNVPFHSRHITREVRWQVEAGLRRAVLADDVRSVFAAVCASGRVDDTE